MTIPVWLVTQDLIFIPLLLVGLALGVAWLANLRQPRVDDLAWIREESFTRPLAADWRKRK